MAIRDICEDRDITVREAEPVSLYPAMGGFQHEQIAPSGSVGPYGTVSSRELASQGTGSIDVDTPAAGHPDLMTGIRKYP
jgi:hypothetical protein